MEKLFERMKAEKLGTYVLVRAWFSEYKVVTKKITSCICDENLYEDLSHLRERRIYLYNKLFGFLFGLLATDYISNELREEYVQELIDMY